MRKNYEKPQATPIDFIGGQLLQHSPESNVPAGHAGPDAYNAYSDQEMLTRKGQGWSSDGWGSDE